jgi:Uma2 family endonuclease
MALAAHIEPWTLEQLHRLPDDGNKYELVRGELFVTPPPGDEHETVLAKLSEILAPYVREHRLGHVYHPKSVMRFEGSEVEPDLMVRARHPDRRGEESDWTRAPIPILVVEVLSDATRRRDRKQKKELYLDAGVTEYWIVDCVARAITVVRQTGDTIVHDQMAWSPDGAPSRLEFPVEEILDA